MMKQAKLETQARLPAPARPLATPTMSDSAMPTLKKRSGNFLAKKSVRVELCTSPSTTTMSVCLPPASAKAKPNASRVDLPSFMISSEQLSISDLRERFLRLLRRQRLAVVVRVFRQEVLDR